MRFYDRQRLRRVFMCSLPNVLLFSIHNSRYFNVQCLEEEITCASAVLFLSGNLI